MLSSYFGGFYTVFLFLSMALVARDQGVEQTCEPGKNCKYKSGHSSCRDNEPCVEMGCYPVLDCEDKHSTVISAKDPLVIPPLVEVIDDPCRTVLCWRGTVCTVQEHHLFCREKNPCELIVCRIGLKCKIKNRKAVCEAPNPCEMHYCDSNQQCIVHQNAPVCIEMPLFPCDEVDCPVNYECVVFNGMTICVFKEPNDSCQNYHCMAGEECVLLTSNPICVASIERNPCDFFPCPLGMLCENIGSFARCKETDFRHRCQRVHCSGYDVCHIENGVPYCRNANSLSGRNRCVNYCYENQRCIEYSGSIICLDGETSVVCRFDKEVCGPGFHCTINDRLKGQKGHMFCRKDYYSPHCLKPIACLPPNPYCPLVISIDHTECPVCRCQYGTLAVIKVLPALKALYQLVEQVQPHQKIRNHQFVTSKPRPQESLGENSQKSVVQQKKLNITQNLLSKFLAPEHQNTLVSKISEQHLDHERESHSLSSFDRESQHFHETDSKSVKNESNGDFYEEIEIKKKIINRTSITFNVETELIETIRYLKKKKKQN